MPGLFACRPGTSRHSATPARQASTERKDNAVDARGQAEVRAGAPGNVLEIRVGRVELDVPRSVGYFGGLAAAVGLGLVEPPLAFFIAAVPAFKVLTNSAFPRAVRFVGEVL
jgi:hypothetical protein